MIWPLSHWQPVVWVWLLGALAFAGLLVKTWRREVPGAWAFRLLALANVIYVGTSAFELVTADSRGWLWIVGPMHLGIGLIGPSVIFLFADITGQNQWLTTKRRALIVGAGLALGALRFVDPWLHWMYSNYEEVFLHNGLVLHRFEVGPAFAVLQGTLIVGMAVGLFLGFKTWREAGWLLRRHILLLSIACLIPIVISTLFAFGLMPWGTLDPTPGGALVALAVASWSMYYDRLGRVAPVARNFLVERLDEGVLVVDRSRAAVDFNPAAQRLLGLTERGSLGRPLAELLSRWPDLRALCSGEQQVAGEIHPQPDGASCWNASWYPLNDPQRRRHQGYMLVLRDVTERKQTELQLQRLLADRTEEWRLATTAALRATEEEQTRIGRLFHDTLCQEVIGFRRTVDAVAETLESDKAAPLRALSGELLDAGRRARDIAHLLEGPDLVHSSFEEALDATCVHLEKAFGLTCEVTVAPSFRLPNPEFGRHLLRIVREAVGNAGRHAQAKLVWIDLFVSGGRLIVTVANDGLPPPAQITEGLGWRQMRMRASLLGASLSLRPGKDGGATFELVLPLIEPASA